MKFNIIFIQNKSFFFVLNNEGLLFIILSSNGS